MVNYVILIQLSQMEEDNGMSLKTGAYQQDTCLKTFS